MALKLFKTIKQLAMSYLLNVCLSCRPRVCVCNISKIVYDMSVHIIQTV